MGSASVSAESVRRGQQDKFSRPDIRLHDEGSLMTPAFVVAALCGGAPRTRVARGTFHELDAAGLARNFG
jgi:hypothetical protein